MNTMLKNIRNGILEKYQYADSLRRRGRFLGGKFISELIDLTESFNIIAHTSGDIELLKEAESYARITEGVVIETKCGKLHEYGFFNPFDDFQDDNTSAYHPEYYDEPEKSDLQINGIKVWNPDTTNKIMFKNGKMVAGQHFDKGDIIERCPCRLINARSLYSDEVRKFAFVVDYANRIYAIPFGYGTCYRNSKEFGVEGNASYYFDDSNPKYPLIVIVATNRIRKGHEIVLISTDEDFENEVRPGQFEYNRGVEPYHTIKSVKIA